MACYDLDAVEFDAAWTEGVLRRATAIRNGQRTTNSITNKRAEFMWDVGAAMSECAVARYTGRPWNGATGGIYDPDAYDVDDNIQVRYATGRGPLRIRQNDLKHKPSTIYVLTWIDSVWTDHRVHFPGWITLGDALEVAEQQTRFDNLVLEVDPKDLHPIRTLKCQPAP
jgi:hypothetical protein